MAPPSKAAVSSVKVIPERVIVAPGPESPLSMAPPSPVAVLSAWDMANPCSVRNPPVVTARMLPVQSGAALGAAHAAVVVPPSPSRTGAEVRPVAGSTTTGLVEVVLDRSTDQLPV